MAEVRHDSWNDDDSIYRTFHYALLTLAIVDLCVHAYVIFLILNVAKDALKTFRFCLLFCAVSRVYFSAASEIRKHLHVSDELKGFRNLLRFLGRIRLAATLVHASLAVHVNGRISSRLRTQRSCCRRMRLLLNQARRFFLATRDVFHRRHHCGVPPVRHALQACDSHG